MGEDEKSYIRLKIKLIYTLTVAHILWIYFGKYLFSNYVILDNNLFVYSNVFTACVYFWDI